MNSIKYVAGAIAAGALAFGALSGGDFAMSKGKRSGSGPAFRVDRDTGADDARPAPAQQSSTAIATAEGSEINTTAALMQVRRTGEKVVTVRLRVSLGRNHDDEWFPELEGDGSWYSAEGLRLVDEANGREHFPLVDADGACLCSTDIHGLNPGETVGVYAKFPAPPADVDRVSIHVPGFQSFDGVALGS